jgi:DNA-directed RNA polymerase III subunit RPC7
VSCTEETPNKTPTSNSNKPVVDLFPTELRPTLSGTRTSSTNPSKKRRTLGVTKGTGITQIERLIQSEQERTNEAEARAEEEGDADDAEDADDDDIDEEKPDAVDEEDNWSAASTDSEESDDDYNAEQYFDNGEDDDIDDADPYENTYE